MEEADRDLLGIQVLAKKLGVSTRTLRFYEDRGLLEPQRVGTARVYTKRESARMQLILRGKRLGFSLREIREFLDLYDADPKRLTQMSLLAKRCRDQIGKLEKQKAALEQTLKELKGMERQALERIAAAKDGPS